MFPNTSRLQSFLERADVKYTTIRHRRDYTAQETAAHTHTPGREFAKAVVLRVDRSYVLAVLPAHRSVDLGKVGDLLDAEQVELATEMEMRALCPDCETGAMPPFGNLYDLPVFIDASMKGDETITFNAGSHEEAIRMAFEDYVRLARPDVTELARVN